ncbi:MAG: hypothetical protein FLDDKLPJ_02709 [Phycisphaerae bacterium]|nr:hypothetical protein [Phycisphaerae bacterium]
MIAGMKAAKPKPTGKPQARGAKASRASGSSSRPPRGARGSSAPSHRQYTLRGVPPEVDRALREAAASQGRSLNDVALEALRRGAGVAEEKKIHHDLDFLFGSLEPDPVFEAVLEEQRRIDPEMWR